MGEQQPLRERPEHEPKLDKEQYEMLRRCSEREDVTEWNDWREKYPNAPVFLEQADLADAHLEGADFWSAHLEGAYFSHARLEGANFWNAYLEGADFWSAHLEDAYFGGAHLARAHLTTAHLKGADFSRAHLEGAGFSHARLEGANFWNAHLERANFGEANLEGAQFQEANLERAHFSHAHLERANFWYAHLEGAYFWHAHLEGADFCHARLEGANFWNAHLEGADFWDAHLEGAYFGGAHLEGADFRMAAVDGGTFLDTPYVDRETDFTGVGLDSARVAPGLKQLLKYNVRRLGWEKWYKEHRVAKWPVRAFWAMSDYGLSIKPILGWFFGLAVAFAFVYCVCSLVWPPGIVSNLLADGKLSVPGWLVPVRAVYFSVVTMTTLGFGDIYAYPKSLAGHLLLTLQVLLGYVLLAALVTRFAVLFTAGGPAWKFPDE